MYCTYCRKEVSGLHRCDEGVYSTAHTPNTFDARESDIRPAPARSHQRRCQPSRGITTSGRRHLPHRVE